MKLSPILTSLALVVFLALGVACQGKRGPSTASGMNRVNFDFDSASIPANMISIMDGNGRYMKKHKSLNIVVEGHADERGTNEYNLALGDRRAAAAKSYLVNEGIKANRLRTVSYGEERPVDNGHNESAWYKNRRAEFVRQ